MHSRHLAARMRKTGVSHFGISLYYAIQQEIPSNHLNIQNNISFICPNQGSSNFLGSRARWAPKELIAGRKGKFYVKNLIIVD